MLEIRINLGKRLENDIKSLSIHGDWDFSQIFQKTPNFNNVFLRIEGSARDPEKMIFSLRSNDFRFSNWKIVILCKF